MESFTRYCEICGRKIERVDDIERFGKHFDSEEHTEQYAREIEARRQTAQEQTTRSSSC